MIRSLEYRIRMQNIVGFVPVKSVDHFFFGVMENSVSTFTVEMLQIICAQNSLQLFTATKPTRNCVLLSFVRLFLLLLILNRISHSYLKFVIIYCKIKVDWFASRIIIEWFVRMRVSVFQYLYIFAMLLMRTNKSIRKYYVICLQYYLVLCLFVCLFTIIKVQSKNIFFLCPHSSLSLVPSHFLSLSLFVCFTTHNHLIQVNTQ